MLSHVLSRRVSHEGQESGCAQSNSAHCCLRQKLLFLFIQMGEMQHVRALQATAAGQEDQSMAESNTVRRSHSVGAACGVRVAESPFG